MAQLKSTWNLMENRNLYQSTLIGLIGVDSTKNHAIDDDRNDFQKLVDSGYFYFEDENIKAEIKKESDNAATAYAIYDDEDYFIKKTPIYNPSIAKTLVTLINWENSSLEIKIDTYVSSKIMLKSDYTILIATKDKEVIKKLEIINSSDEATDHFKKTEKVFGFSNYDEIIISIEENFIRLIDGYEVGLVSTGYLKIEKWAIKKRIVKIYI